MAKSLDFGIIMCNIVGVGVCGRLWAFVGFSGLVPRGTIGRCPRCPVNSTAWDKTLGFVPRGTIHYVQRIRNTKKNDSVNLSYFVDGLVLLLWTIHS